LNSTTHGQELTKRRSMCTGGALEKLTNLTVLGLFITMENPLMSLYREKIQRELPSKHFRKSQFSFRNRLGRQIWSFVNFALFRPSPRFLNCWRRFILRLFGAKVGKKVRIQPSVKIWAPWNLYLEDYCSIGVEVDCYSVGKIRVGECTTVSQGSVLCTASHDYTVLHLPLIVKDIVIKPYVWLCAEVFVMPGVTIGEGTVIGVRSVVFKDIPSWKVAWGCPCRAMRPRALVSD